MEEKQKLTDGDVFPEMIRLDSTIEYEAGGTAECAKMYATAFHAMGDDSTWSFLYASIQEQPWKKNKVR